jgi:hypothetical protein
MSTYWITTAGYLILLLVALILWFVTRGTGGTVASMAEVFKRVMHYRGTRVGLILAWWWLGYHFLVNVVGR